MPPKYKVHERIARTSSNASFDGGPDGKKYERVVKEIDQEIGTRETKLVSYQITVPYYIVLFKCNNVPMIRTLSI